MKDYSLLLNQTYLYLKENPMEKPNFSKIATKVGLTRQTVSKEYNAMQLSQEDFDIQNFHNEETNKYKRALAIINDLDGNKYELSELATMLGVSRSMISKYYNQEIMSAVYCCKYDNEVVYVGSTSNYKERIETHYRKIDNNENDDIYLYEYLKDKDKSKIEFFPILTNIDKNTYLQLEKNLIKVLNPICNVEFL